MDAELEKELGGYFEAEEPGMRERAIAWGMAIGLQKVDGLTPSQFLLDVAKDHIEGRITQRQAHRRINAYYAAKDETNRPDPAKEEPDKVSVRIVAILGDGGFEFTPEYYVSIHARLFRGILANAGKYRTYNIRKREWVLKDDSVTYGSAATLKASLRRHFLDEKEEFDYAGKPPKEIIHHFSRFIAQIWQVHPFGEGNTRTTAIFAVKYLNSLGYAVTNDMFRDNSWYFRNALVRANYADYATNVQRDWSYLEAFFRNLLLGEKNELKSRYLLVGLTDDDKQKIRELSNGRLSEKRLSEKRLSEKRLSEKGLSEKGGKKTEAKGGKKTDAKGGKKTDAKGGKKTEAGIANKIKGEVEISNSESGKKTKAKGGKKTDAKGGKKTEARGGKKTDAKSGKKSRGGELAESGNMTTEKVLFFLREYPHLTFEGLVNALHISRSAIQKHIARLKAAGRLRRIGPDKGGHWEVVG